MIKSTLLINILLPLLVVSTANSMLAQNGIQYTDKAIKVFPDASFIMGKDVIAAYYVENPMENASRAPMTEVAANTYYTYQINALTINRSPYKEVVILTKDGKRDFEFIAADSGQANIDLSGIKLARQKWVELCNAHDAAALIDQLYHDPTLYYNHRPPVTTKNDLTKLYSYMNNPAYSLNLSPIHTSAVNENLALEIGQCSGSYPGKYIIIWKKHPKFGWQVLVDSNI